ncbi:MAG: phosphopyruvate hydratase [archaeon]|nr:phosphopyruvate hydratase [archaeon]MCP8315976.1 phosphopyruvate hydratase [archaeon]
MGRASIESIKSRICYDSRGDESIEVDVKVNGFIGRACAPKGASTGKYEAVSFNPNGIEATLKLLSEYSSKLIGFDASNPRSLSQLLREIDGTGNFSRIGGSTAYAISIATAEAFSKSKGIPLYKMLLPKGPYLMPYPLGNVLCGGKHAGHGAPDIQEFLICPLGVKNIKEGLRANITVHREVRKQIEKKDPYFTGGKGDEGGWAPRIKDEEAFDLVSSSSKIVSDALGIDIRLGVDFASSSLWDGDTKAYIYSRAGVKRSSEEQLDFIIELVKKYHLLYLEDPFHEEAYDEFAELTKKLSKVYIVGDDIFVTNTSRLLKGVKMRAGNAAILKVNQAGTLGDALDFSENAKKHGYTLITSHRSGDTSDVHLAHIAIATQSKMIKSGVVGGERLSKLNELLRIDEEFGGCNMAKLEV